MSKNIEVSFNVELKELYSNLITLSKLSPRLGSCHHEPFASILRLRKSSQNPRRRLVFNQRRIVLCKFKGEADMQQRLGRGVSVEPIIIIFPSPAFVAHESIVRL